MGKQGMRKVANICYQRAHYAAAEIGRLPGFEILTPEPFFKEFAVRTPRPVAEIKAALRSQEIIPGYDLSKDYPHLGDALLVCVTEMNTKDDIDTLVAALRGL